MKQAGQSATPVSPAAENASRPDDIKCTAMKMKYI